MHSSISIAGRFAPIALFERRRLAINAPLADTQQPYSRRLAKALCAAGTGRPHTESGDTSYVIARPSFAPQTAPSDVAARQHRDRKWAEIQRGTTEQDPRRRPPLG